MLPALSKLILLIFLLLARLSVIERKLHEDKDMLLSVFPLQSLEQSLTYTEHLVFVEWITERMNWCGSFLSATDTCVHPSFSLLVYVSICLCFSQHLRLFCMVPFSVSFVRSAKSRVLTAYPTYSFWLMSPSWMLASLPGEGLYSPSHIELLGWKPLPSLAFLMTELKVAKATSASERSISGKLLFASQRVGALAQDSLMAPQAAIIQLQ